ncbi:MAG: tetratricopeptide repeat protein [Proteobacteria bacterium]|nr:tetratricopeptide repeat protein [Pseudomonadota bacterium]
MLFVLWAVLGGTAFAADWSLEVVSIEVDGAKVSQATLQITPPQQASALSRPVQQGQSFAVGTVIAVPARTTLMLKSSNANSVRLLPGSRIRVLAGSDVGEEFGQETGESFFDIKRALNFFNVRHGRFQAIVKGTRYSVKVVPEKEIAFDVAEGSVRIEREGKLKIDEGNKEGTITVSETLKAGERKTYRLDIDEYLARFKNFGEAETYYRKNLEADRQSGDPIRIGTGLNQVGIVLVTLSKYREAIPFFDESRQIAITLFPGGVHATIADSLNNLGVAHSDLGGTANLQRAIGYHEESLKILRQLYPGGVHAGIASSLNNLGTAYRALGGTDNLQRAIRYQEESLKVLRELYPDGVHADIATSLNNLGTANANLGDRDNLQRARGYFEESLTIQRQLYPDGVHADIAASFNNLGNTYRALGGTDNLQQAIGYYEESLKIQRQLYPGGVHGDIAQSINNLGAAYADLGGTDNLQRAVRFFEESLTIQRQLYPGSEHADIATSLHNLGAAYRALGGTDNLRQAIGYYDESVKLQRQLYPGGMHSDIGESLGNLSFTRLLVGQNSEALRNAREALQIAPDQLWIRINEAHALLLMGREAEALEIYTQYRDKPLNATQTVREAVLDDFAALRKAGVNHPGMATVEALYGKPAAPPRRSKP